MPEPRIESLVSVCHKISGNVQRARRQADGAALVCGRMIGGKQFRRVNGPDAMLISDSPLGSKNKNLIRTRDGSRTLCVGAQSPRPG
jgi:hypothetical protein